MKSNKKSIPRPETLLQSCHNVTRDATSPGKGKSARA